MGRIRRSIQGGLKRGATGVLRVVSNAVGRHNLFEQPGERAPTPPLPPRDSPAVPPSPVRPPSARAPVEPRSVKAAPPTQPAPAGAASERPAEPTLDANEDGCRVVDLAQLQTILGKGGGVRVVNHWATWCIPCVEEFDTLQHLYKRLPDGTRFFGVSWDLFDPRGDEDDIAEHVANFAAGHHLPWPSVLIGEEVQARAFFDAFSLRNETIPQTWVIDANGNVVHRIDGTVTPDHIEPVLAALQAACSTPE